MAKTASRLWPLPLEELIRMHEQGMSLREIARRCGVSHNTIRKAMQGLYPRRELRTALIPQNSCPVCGTRLETALAAANRLGADSIWLRERLHVLAGRSSLSCVSRIGNCLIAPPAVWNLLAKVSMRKPIDPVAIIERYKVVRNQARVARDLGVSPTTVHRVLRQAQVPMRSYQRWKFYQDVARRALRCPELDLTERQRVILEECLRQRSLTAVGAHLGITKERVRQVLQQAGARLAHKGWLERDYDARQA